MCCSYSHATDSSEVVHLKVWDPQPDTITPAGPDPPLPQGETLSLTYHPVPAHLTRSPRMSFGPAMAEPPRFGKLAERDTRIWSRFMPRRTRVHGLPAHAALIPACSDRFPPPAPQPRDRISYPLSFILYPFKINCRKLLKLTGSGNHNCLVSIASYLLAVHRTKTTS